MCKLCISIFSTVYNAKPLLRPEIEYLFKVKTYLGQFNNVKVRKGIFLDIEILPAVSYGFTVKLESGALNYSSH